MEPNKLLKSLRKERGVSQSDLASGISARNTLGNYEKDGTSINFHVLRMYLERLNVSIEEFDFRSPLHSENPKKILSTTLKNYYYHQDFKQLINLLEKLEKEVDKDNDFYYFHLLAQYRLLLDKEGVFLLEKSKVDYYVDKIKEYLSRIDSWGKFEASIFINFMYIFETDYVLHMLSYVGEKNQTFNTLFKKYLLLEKMHINALYLFAERGDKHLIPVIIESLKKVIDSDNLKDKVIISFFEGIVENDESKRNRALQTLRTFDMSSHADYLSSLCQ